MASPASDPDSGPLIITRAAMFEPLLLADPSFRAQHDAFVADWAEEPELPSYLLLADYARHLAAKLEAGETSCFAGIFDVVEAWHINGDPYVREAATIGLLEDLQNPSNYKCATPTDFLPWLRPVSKRWWVRVEAFWAGDSDALRVEDKTP
jgi:hypothetical protein